MRAATLISSPWMRTALAPSAMKPPERALRLEADQQHGGLGVPQPALEMVADTAGVAHAAGGDDDVEAGELGDRLALLDRLGAAQMRRAKQPLDVEIGLQAFGMLPEHFGGANGQRRIEKDRRRRDVAALHQVDQIDDQFLRALDREGRNEQRAAGGMRRRAPRRRDAARRDSRVTGGRSSSP